MFCFNQPEAVPKLLAPSIISIISPAPWGAKPKAICTALASRCASRRFENQVVPAVPTVAILCHSQHCNLFEHVGTVLVTEDVSWSFAFVLSGNQTWSCCVGLQEDRRFIPATAWSRLFSVQLLRVKQLRAVFPLRCHYLWTWHQHHAYNPGTDRQKSWDLPGSWTRIFKEVWQHKLMVKVAVDPVLRMEVMTTQIIMIVTVLTMINTKIITYNYIRLWTWLLAMTKTKTMIIMMMMMMKMTWLKPAKVHRSWDPSARSASMASMGRGTSFVQAEIDIWSNPKSTSLFDIWICNTSLGERAAYWA